jgi:hypothetical protein
MILSKFDYEAPSDLPEACEIKARYRERACLLAGGTDLLVALGRGSVSPSLVVALERISEIHLAGIQPFQGRWLALMQHPGLSQQDLGWFAGLEPGQWLARRPRKTIPDIISLVSEYRRFIKGAVVYDARVPATSNVASTIAGVENLIAVRYDTDPDSLYAKLIKQDFVICRASTFIKSFSN